MEHESRVRPRLHAAEIPGDEAAYVFGQRDPEIGGAPARPALDLGIEGDLGSRHHDVAIIAAYPPLVEYRAMVGRTLGHYRIEEQIGAGGMGIVYRARDLQLGRSVALKVVGEREQVGDKARERLLREARTASALNHPNICTVYEAGEADGQMYIAMELVEGRPLSALIGSEGLAVETVIRYGAQIADALSHAHERGVVHRDLKSANVIVTPEGRAKVLDFGLAKRIVEETEATRTEEPLTEAGAVAGTLSYMARG
jgi:serine/threonine protein kinase